MSNTPWRLWHAVLPISCLAILVSSPAPAGPNCRLPEGVPPDIGAWFWESVEDFRPGECRAFLDLAADHSPFRLLTTSQRVPKEITDADVHERFKEAAAYARRRGLALVLDLDVRLARAAFQKAYPDELQELLRIREADLAAAGETRVTVKTVGGPKDHMTWGSKASYYPLAGRLVRVYSYVRGAAGIEPKTVRDITASCTVAEASAKQVVVSIPGGKDAAGRKAAVMAAFTHFTPDVFAPHLLEFQRAIFAAYKDLPLGGAMKDEWGFPASSDTIGNDFWFSSHHARAYARKTGGRDLVRDCLRMFAPERGSGRDRQAAVNYFVELAWRRNAEIEADFYRATKETFGRDAFVGVHPTWIGTTLGKRELNKNGWDWWAVRRDFGQSDEETPYCCRTALAKKCGGAVWYNQFYAGPKDVPRYAQELWRGAVTGGRLNYHPLFPPLARSVPATLPLLRGDLMRGQCRVRLLNFISRAPLDCPVAVVFGHPAATNWAGPVFNDSGTRLAGRFWSAGFAADLIPSYEIGEQALQVGADGFVQYGSQRYAAAILYHPEFEKPQTVAFWKKAAAGGKTALYRVGDWTTTFDGKPINGNAQFPKRMAALPAADEYGMMTKVVAGLSGRGLSPSCRHKGLSGRCRLIDGTEIVAAADPTHVAGLPIQTTITIGGQKATVDAVGVVAVRLGKDGKVEALAAGGLKAFRAGAFTVELAKRADLAMWRDEKGRWQGVLQGCAGPVPPPLAALTHRWLRLDLPSPLPRLPTLAP